jgi:hypothetical protein
MLPEHAAHHRVEIVTISHGRRVWQFLFEPFPSVHSRMSDPNGRELHRDRPRTLRVKRMVPSAVT